MGARSTSTDRTIQWIWLSSLLVSLSLAALFDWKTDRRSTPTLRSLAQPTVTDEAPPLPLASSEAVPVPTDVIVAHEETEPTPPFPPQPEEDPAAPPHEESIWGPEAFHSGDHLR